MFRKRAPPAVGKIKDRHVEHEHGVMPVRASKKVAQPGPEIVFALVGFHSVSCFMQNPRPTSASRHEALAGFWSASFEGGKKIGVSSSESLNFQGLGRLT